MANTDLVKKKPVAIEAATYERLSKLAAQLRIDNPGGGFVSMSTAVGVLLDSYAVINQLNAAREEWVKDYPKTGDRFVFEVTGSGIQPYQVHPDREGDEWIELENETK